MSIQYYYPKTSEEKMELMEFVYKNTDSFILNTFGYLWESRGWWDKFPIQVSKSGSVITGLHAFTVDTKAPNTIKTYYIVTGKAFRKMGIAKALTYDMLNEFKNSGKNIVLKRSNTVDFRFDGVFVSFFFSLLGFSLSNNSC